jgi:hypothetical protein
MPSLQVFGELREGERPLLPVPLRIREITSGGFAIQSRMRFAIRSQHRFRLSADGQFVTIEARVVDTARVSTPGDDGAHLSRFEFAFYTQEQRDRVAAILEGRRPVVQAPAGPPAASGAAAESGAPAAGSAPAPRARRPVAPRSAGSRTPAPGASRDAEPVVHSDAAPAAAVPGPPRSVDVTATAPQPQPRSVPRPAPDNADQSGSADAAAPAVVVSAVPAADAKYDELTAVLAARDAEIAGLESELKQQQKRHEAELSSFREALADRERQVNTLAEELAGLVAARADAARPAPDAHASDAVPASPIPAVLEDLTSLQDAIGQAHARLRAAVEALTRASR